MRSVGQSVCYSRDTVTRSADIQEAGIIHVDPSQPPDFTDPLVSDGQASPFHRKTCIGKGLLYARRFTSPDFLIVVL